MKAALILSTLTLALAALGCEEAAPDVDPDTASPAATAEAEAALSGDVLVEEHDGGTISWSIAGDGQVKALVKGGDGAQVSQDVAGSLAWKAGADAEAKAVALAPDPKTKLLVAAGPALEAELTEIGYTVTVDGKPWSGTLHLPKGGTAELVATARASADAELEGKLGPHGGVLVVVAGDRFEIVADDVTGEVRVYLLDAELEVVAMGEREVTLGVVADTPQMVVLLPEPEAGLYLTGKLKLDADPSRITFALRREGKVHVVIVGHGPNVHLRVGAKAPRVKIRAKGKAIAAVDAKLHGTGKVKVKGPNVDAKVKVKEPKVKAKASAGKGAKAKASVKIGF